jgi:hypothetical protein
MPALNVSRSAPTVEDRDDRRLARVEAGVAQQAGEAARQVRVGEVVVPLLEHAQHPVAVARVPDDRVPVGVQHEQPAAGAQHPPRLDQRRRDVLDVLVHQVRRRVRCSSGTAAQMRRLPVFDARAARP